MSIVDRHPSWLTHPSRSGPIQRADRLKIQNPREECTSVFPQILWKRQRVVAERSPLKKRDSFSCRHCFPVFSSAAPEWLYHFRSSGRHFDSYAHIMDWESTDAAWAKDFSRFRLAGDEPGEDVGTCSGDWSDRRTAFASPWSKIMRSSITMHARSRRHLTAFLCNSLYLGTRVFVELALPW